MPGTTEIRTSRLLLRRHVPEDAVVLHANFGLDPTMYEYSGWNPYATPEAAAGTIAHFIESYADPRFYGWAIEHADKLVGTLGAYDYDARRNAIEIGISIERASWGKGFATEALTAALRYLAHDEGIASVTAWCAADNVASKRALEKAGMTRTNVEPDALHLENGRLDKANFVFRA